MNGYDDVLEGADHVVVHLPSGLGPTDADALQQQYAEAGAASVVLDWASDSWSGLRQRGEAVAADPLYQQLLPTFGELLARRLAPGSSLRQAAELPPIDWRDPSAADVYDAVVDPSAATPLGAAEMAALQELLAADSGLTRQFAVALGDSSSLLRADVREAAAVVVKGGGAELALAVVAAPVLARAVDRMARGRHHGAMATLVEELFRGLFVDPAGGPLGDQVEADARDPFLMVGGPGQLLADQLEAWAPEDSGRRITLVGEGPGAVGLCRALAVLHDRAIEAQIDVVFAGAAVGWDLWESTARQFGEQVGGWALLGREAEAERAEVAVPGLYPGSALSLLSALHGPEGGPHDRPLIGQQRGWTRGQLSDEEQRAMDAALSLTDGIRGVQWTGGDPREELGAAIQQMGGIRQQAE